MRLTYVGGPTALIEWRGARLLTDPTFDPAGSEYQTPAYTLVKTQSPSLAADALGEIDAVLLSHDHHFDNLDRAGRELLPRARQVLTTVEGAGRLGAGAVGLEPWQETDVAGALVTATPARHGPEGGDRGPVIGFVLDETAYIAGDTVLYEGVLAVFERFEIGVAVLNLGAATVAAAGPKPLTFTAAEAVELARAAPDVTIVPLHFEGWEHFSEGRAEVEQAFAAAGLSDRLLWPRYGETVEWSSAT